jgi:hypothetical protein
VSEEPASDNTQKAASTDRGKLSHRTIIAIMALVALFVPFSIQPVITPWYQYIILLAMTWQSDYWNPYLLLNPITLIGRLLFSGLRLVFVGMIHRLYKGTTTRKRAIIAGIAAELQLVTIFYIPFLIMVLLDPYSTYHYPVVIPIPLLLILGVILLRISPPPREPSVWRDDDKEVYLWEESEDDDEIKIKMRDRLLSRLDSSEENERK